MAVIPYSSENTMIFRRDAMVTEDLMHLYDPQQEIFSVELCKTRSPQELIDITTSCYERFKTAFEGSKESIDDSRTYSQKVGIAEKALLSLQNVKNVLIEHHISEEICSSETISTLESQLSEMKKNMPLGPSILLHMDVQNIEKMGTIPANETYTLKQVTYYQPKTCHMELGEYFERYRREGDYVGETTAPFVEQFYGLSFETPLSFVSLKKSKSQQRFEHGKLSKRVQKAKQEKTHAESFLDSLKQTFVDDSDQIITSRKKQKENLLEIISILKSLIPEHPFLENANEPVLSPSRLLGLRRVNKASNQYKLLKNLVEQGRFSSFKVLSTSLSPQELLTITTLETTVQYDFILFFHTRVKNEERVS